MGADYTQLLVQGGKLVGVDPEEAPEMAVLGYDNLEAILDGWHTMGKLIREDANDRRAGRRVLSKGQARVEVFSVRTDR
jgi:hypothetical protein